MGNWETEMMCPGCGVPLLADEVAIVLRQIGSVPIGNVGVADADAFIRLACDHLIDVVVDRTQDADPVRYALHLRE
jgi:hypothetical protein